jgi:hypothetical protein
MAYSFFLWFLLSVAALRARELSLLALLLLSLMLFLPFFTVLVFI